MDIKVGENLIDKMISIVGTEESKHVGAYCIKIDQQNDIYCRNRI